jgi:hypothetical protein
MKTYLTEATILSVYDFQNNKKILLGKFINGIIDKDETNRFQPNFRVIT